MEEPGSPPAKSRNHRSLRRSYKGLARDVASSTDDTAISQPSSRPNSRASRRPSLPALGAVAAASIDYLPGISLLRGDLGTASTPPGSPFQSQKAKGRPTPFRTRSNDEDSPKTNSAHSRLRTRTIDNGAQSRKHKVNGSQDRQIMSAGNSGPLSPSVEQEASELREFEPSERRLRSTRKSRPIATPPASRKGDADNDEARQQGSASLNIPAWDAGNILEIMTRIRGRMQGFVRIRWNTTLDWTSSYCCVNDMSGSLLYERRNKATTDNALISDLRGCQVRASLYGDLQTRILHIRPNGKNAVLHLCPAYGADFDSWFAAVLCWQTMLHQQLPNGKKLQDQRPPPASRRHSRSSWNSQLSKDATIIKVGKMLTHEFGDSDTGQCHLPAYSNEFYGDSFATRPKWREVSCVLKDNGKLKLYIPNDATVISVIRLTKLPRVAIQRLESSAFDANHCIAIYPQYALSKNASSQLRPIILCLESRVLQEVWYVLCRAFTVPGVHGSQQSVAVDSLQSSELLPGLSRTSSQTVDFRLERSLQLQVSEAKFWHQPGDSAETADGTDFLLHELNTRNSELFFAQVLIDGQVRAKTTVKYSPESVPGWYEKFDFSEIPHGLASATVIVRSQNYNASSAQQNVSQSPRSSAPNTDHTDTVEYEDVHCGEVYLELDDTVLSDGKEKWLPLLSISGEHIGAIKLRIAVEQYVILFDQEYQQLSEILHHFANGLTILIAEKTPTELVRLAEYLLNVFQVSDKASEWLKSLAEEEVDGIQGDMPQSHRRRFRRRLESNESSESNYSAATREVTVRDMAKTVNGEVSLLFRGNTLFTKAMDVHMKRLGKEYLEETLGDKMKEICFYNIDCEVDTNKFGPAHDFSRSRRELLRLTNEVWALIYASASRCPMELRMIFRHVRACADARYGDLSRSVKYSSVSGFLFLRFFCPAIFSPKLFGLVNETPKLRAQRTFTLIAKTLQALANMISLGQKEPWMEPMNQFLVARRQEFKTFIDSICSVPTDQQNPPVVPSYTTPHAIFTRIPPAAREGFPSLPYLIDHSRSFAGLVNLWLDTHNATPTHPPLLPQQHPLPFEGDLATFHALCVDIRHRTTECYAAALRADARDARDDADKDSAQHKWAALAERMESDPVAFWDPAPASLAMFAAAGSAESRTRGGSSFDGAAPPEERRARSRMGSSAASSDAEGVFAGAPGPTLPGSRDGERSGGEPGKGVFGLFGRKKRGV